MNTLMPAATVQTVVVQKEEAKKEVKEEVKEPVKEVEVKNSR